MKLPDRINLNDYTTFGRKAIRAYFSGGYVGAIISGAFGKGKSTSAIHLGREILEGIYGLSRIEAYRLLIDKYTLFTMDEVLEQTKSLKNKEFWENLTPQQAIYWKAKIRKPLLIWDDAAKHGSKYKHFLDMGDAYELQSNFDTIRDITSCVIITAPEDEELLKFLRSYRGNYLVEVLNSGGGEWNRVLEFYAYEKDPLGRRRKRKKWRTKPFSIYVEKEIYGKYIKKKMVAEIENAQRYDQKKKVKEAKAKYYETRQKYYQAKLENELKELDNP